MALKETVRDPLNWVLLILALAFGYYVIAIPYWTNHYLKTPQRMTLGEYLANPSHPRPFMLHALGSPPASIEVILTELRVAHIDADSLLLESAAALPAAPGVPEATVEQEAPAAGEAAAVPEVPVEAVPELPAEAGAAMGPEQPAPKDQVLVPGENMDLLELSVGQVISLQVHGLHETPLGWVPLEPDLDRETEEFFTKEELDALERLKIHADGNLVAVPYVDTDELRFADGVHPAGEPHTLDELANDTRYIQTVNRLAGGSVDLQGVRLVGRGIHDRSPFFAVEDDEGRRARVFYNPRLLSEWYWALDRLGEGPVVARGVLRPLSPPELRGLEAEGNVQAVMDGYALLSPDGAVVINLENPAGPLTIPTATEPG